MPKAIKTVYAILFFGVTFSAIILRTVQLLRFTDSSSGSIIKGAENTIFMFYALCAASLILIAFLLSKKSGGCENPLSKKNRALCAAGAAAGLSMFYDFVHQCINCYEYISKTSYAEMNYFIPLCVSGAAALACAFYYIIIGISFNTDKYDFKQFRFFHTMPIVWALSGLLVGITRFIDKLYAEEIILQYAVLISGIIFYIAFISCIDENGSALRFTGCAGLAYAVLAFSISLPRMAVFAFGYDVSPVVFSSVTYFFSGAFALVFSLNIFKSQKKDY